MLPLLVIQNALAEPQPVVAMGDGVVAGSPHRAPLAPAMSSDGSAQSVAPAAEGDAAVPGGWVTVLADCLQERAPERFAVVDRATPGDTVGAAQARLAGVRELAPAWVILTLGAQELADERVDAKKLGKELDALVDELREKGEGGEPARPPNVLLVGMVPPTLAQADPSAEPEKQASIDGRTAGWNKVLASIAAPGQGVTHLDLWSDWPREGEPRAALTANGWSLSDQGHAKIAASVCDAVLAARP